MTVTINGTTGIVTPTSTGDVSVGNDLLFTGTGNRITGDFSNATENNRVTFQNSVTNGATNISAIPNGTGTATRWQAFNNSDKTNASLNQIVATASEAQYQSAITGTGTYLPMTFATGGSERMRIDTSGNVGIGTSSPAKRLSVVNATDSTTVGANAVMTVQAGSSVNSVAEIGFAYGTWSGTNPICSVGYQLTSNAGVGAGALTFSTRSVTTDTAPTERARIDSSGTLLIGQTSQSFSGNGLLSVLGLNAAYAVSIGAPSTGGTYYYVDLRTSAGVQTGAILSANGTNTSYNTSSDYRLKENIAPMTGALATVAQLKPCTYTWKVNGSTGQGFIAHELQEVVPECVTGEKDAVDAKGKPVYQGIDTSFLVATLTAAIQELKTELDTVKAELATLKGN